MGTTELISELSKKEAFRVVLNFCDLVEADKADEKAIQDRKQAKQEQHKKGLEMYSVSKKNQERITITSTETRMLMF